MRFLCDWQHVSPATRMSGPEALVGVLAQLEGFEAPAAAWEKAVLLARVTDYTPTWLDDLCTTGHITWARLRASTVDAGGGKTVRSTPIVLLPRRQLALWSSVAASAPDDEAPLSSRAELVVEFLHANGASFFDELLHGAHLLRTELEDVLAELVARGRITCDSFAGLRALLVPGSKRPTANPRRGRRASVFGIEGAGRWTLTRRTLDRHPREGGDPATFALTADANAKSLGSRLRGNDERKSNGVVTPRKNDPAAVEHIALTLLQRYGVVCWRLLEREAAWLPPWRELLRVYHRLEARGEIRGGRFVAGLSGEQFALPDAIAVLRAIRKRPHDGALLVLSALDPLNLVGTLLPGGKVPRVLGARVVYRDGLPLGTLVAGVTELLGDLSPADEQAVRHALLRGTHQASPTLLSPSPASVVQGLETSVRGLTRH
jgi:ATP-dependent Lhr-like helicase